MWGSGSLDLAKGKKFLNQLLYVQHVDKEKDTTSTISEQSLREYLLVNHKIFSDSNFSEYLRNPKANVGILKSSLKDVITHVQVYSNPLPVAMLRSEVTIHAFVAITTKNRRTKKEMWYSIEKNGKNIVLQQSPYEYDVTEKLYDAEKMELVQRPEPVTERKSARGNFRGLERLLRAIWETNQLSTNYHLLFSNCQNLASFVFRKSNSRKKWSTVTSAIVDRFGLRNKKTKSESLADSMKYNWIEKDDKFAYYKAMIERNRKDLEKLIANNLTNESINSVDSQGYTLLEWARVFSTSDWPIDQYLKDVGARNTSNEKTFRRNVFFIALQFLSSNKSRLLSFDGIYLRGVNKTGDSALHLALYGEKWDVAENILSEFKDYDVNVTNSLGCLPLYLSLGYSPFDLPVQFEFKMALMKKILSRTNSENVNKHINRYGDSALHYAITNQSKTVVEELLKHKDVDMNSKNKRNCTSLHLASKWKEIPVDLFKKILKKSTYVNAQDEDGNTALHVAVLNESKTAIKELLKRTDVDVNVRCIDNRTALQQNRQLERWNQLKSNEI
jgi:ankyrin repeat protein